MISTTLEWLKNNIVVDTVISVFTSLENITVTLCDGTVYVADFGDIRHVFNATPAVSENAPANPDDRWPSPRGGNTDARLWGG